jgi:hypothetical protein
LDGCSESSGNICMLFVYTMLVGTIFLGIKMRVQTCRTLLGKLTIDKHLYVAHVGVPAPSPPTMLQCILRQQTSHHKEPSNSGRRYFANPMSTFML